MSRRFRGRSCEQFRRAVTLVVLTMSVALVGCSGEGGGAASPAPLSAEELQWLNAVEARVAEIGYCDLETLRLLWGLHADLPEDQDVARVLRQALVFLGDWDGIILLEERMTGGKASLARAGLDDNRRAQIGMIYMLAGRYEEASEALLPLTRRLEPDATIDLAAGQCLFHLGRYEEAAPLLERASAAFSTGEAAGQVRLLQGLIAMYGGDPERGWSLIEASLELSPRSIPVLNAAGRALAALGRDVEAATYFDRAREYSQAETSDKSRVMLLTSFARSTSEARASGDVDRCRALVETTAARVEPEVQVELFRSLAQLLREVGREAEALEAEARASSIEEGIVGPTPGGAGGSRGEGG